MSQLRALFRSCVAWRNLALPLLLAFMTGCVSGPPGPRVDLPAGHAEVAVTNLTSYPWRLALQAPGARDAIQVEVQPRETFAVTIPGGAYVIEQTLLEPERDAAVSRRLEATFEAGERYRWNLATLQPADDLTTQ